jgi:hypothetical protein
LRKQKYTLKDRETKMTRRSLKYLDELIIMEEKKRKEREKKTRRESQLPVFVNEILASVNTP